MLTTNKTPQLITTEEAMQRAEQLKKEFPSLLTASGFENRLLRAQAIATRGTVIEMKPGVFRVQSESNPAGFYLVDTIHKSCTCPDAGKHPNRPCKHRLAIALYAGWKETPAEPAPVDLSTGYYGWINNGRFPRLLVKITNLDAEANLVTIQVESRDSAGRRVQPFTHVSGSPSSILTTTPDVLRSIKFQFTPAQVEEVFEDSITSHFE